MRRKGSEKRSLPVKLTHTEMLEKAEQHAWLLNRQLELTVEHEDLRNRMKAEKQEVQNGLAANAEILRTHAENRTVDVEVLVDDNWGKVFWVRADYDEVIESRDVYPDERQLDLVNDDVETSFIDAVERFREKARLAEEARKGEDSET